MRHSDYRLPAEWERHSALLLAWPFAGGDWDDALEAIQDEYAALIRTVAGYQRMVLIIQPGSQDARAKLGELPGLRFIEARYNDTWCRDFGPVTLCHAGRRLALDFYFDGWGGRHEAKLDNRVNTLLARNELFADIDFRQSHFELEGGAIESDGNNTLLINRHCMRARHPQLQDREVDFELKSWLNIEHLIEIDMPPIAGDDTDGHIDTLARFSSPGRIVFQSLRAPADTQKLTGQLEALRDVDGRAFELLSLPCPDDLDPGLAASYANFVLINDAVLVPAYGSRHDAGALELLAGQFPDRKAEAVDARTLVSQGGGPHCACMQIPTNLA
ncbi:MAG: agmatine deiminase family protein [Wenzhouxiangellaceae bacterium]|nr:agmatine deiminase family protein [Wenzhouxiangellaceae bacterium]